MSNVKLERTDNGVTLPRMTRLTKAQVAAVRAVPEGYFCDVTEQTALLQATPSVVRQAYATYADTVSQRTLNSLLARVDEAWAVLCAEVPEALEESGEPAPKAPKATKAAKAPKADKAPKASEPTTVRDDVRAFLDGLASGEVAERLENDHLTAGRLARGLGIHSVAPVVKYLTGKRVPRPQPEPGTAADLLARWWVGELAIDEELAMAATPKGGAA